MTSLLLMACLLLRSPPGSTTSSRGTCTRRVPAVQRVLGAAQRRGERRVGDAPGDELLVAQLDDAGRVLRESRLGLLGQAGAIQGIFPGADDVVLVHGGSPVQAVVVGQQLDIPVYV